MAEKSAACTFDCCQEWFSARARDVAVECECWDKYCCAKPRLLRPWSLPRLPLGAVPRLEPLEVLLLCFAATAVLVDLAVDGLLVRFVGVALRVRARVWVPAVSLLAFVLLE